MVAPRRLFVWIALCMSTMVTSGCGTSASVESVNPEPVNAEVTTAPASPGSITAADVDTAVNDVVADPAPTVAPGRSRGQQSASEQTYTSIRDVDFENGFTYTTELHVGPGTTTVTEGSYEHGEFGDLDYHWFGVTDVVFGDLDGDRTEEAIVATTWNGGGTGYFDSVTAYRLIEGQVHAAGTVPFGDRADGGIFDTRIGDGVAEVWSFSTTLGACCANRVTRNSLVLGSQRLVMAERGITRTWMSLSSNGPDEELAFLPGTSSAVVAVYDFETHGSFTFEAAKGQLLTLQLTDGPAPTDISVIDLSTGMVMSGLAAMVLPTDGYYEVHVSFDGERADKTIIDVIIDGDDNDPAVQWKPAVEQVLVTDEPLVHTSLVWPVFSAAAPGTGAANQALAAFVTALDDNWIEDVTEYSEPLDDSTFDLTYEVTLVATSIVSVRFDYYGYVCCRPYPNYGPRAAVLDLESGRLLEAGEIIDTNRLDAVVELWIRELDKNEVLGDTVASVLAERPQFDSLALVPGGIEFGTERNGLGGGTPGTLTVVSFEQLGDLVSPDLVTRVTIG